MRTGSTILILVFVWNICGYYGMYYVLRWQVRQAPAMDTGTWFAEEELADAEWLNAHEVVYRHRLYDVREKTCRNGIVWLCCVADEKEQDLNHAHASITRVLSGDAAGTLPGPVKSWIKKYKDQDRPLAKLQPLPACSDALPGATVSCRPTSPALRPFVPPPEVHSA